MSAAALPMTCSVIAHRGASAYAPEHTLAAYDRALELGADVLELDVRVTADGALVIVHDPTLERTLGDGRAVADLTRADLDRIDPVDRPLTLDTVLTRYGRSTRLLVELKDPTPGWALGLAESIDRRGLTDRVVIQSFDRFALRHIRAAAPGLRLSPLMRSTPNLGRELDAIAGYADGIGVLHAAVDARLVRAAHASGLEVRAWTVNDPAEMDRLLDLGVDGIITDVPDLLHAALLRNRPARVGAPA